MGLRKIIDKLFFLLFIATSVICVLGVYYPQENKGTKIERMFHNEFRNATYDELFRVSAVEENRCIASSFCGLIVNEYKIYLQDKFNRDVEITKPCRVENVVKSVRKNNSINSSNSLKIKLLRCSCSNQPRKENDIHDFYVRKRRMWNVMQFYVSNLGYPHEDYDSIDMRYIYNVPEDTLYINRVPETFQPIFTSDPETE